MRAKLIINGEDFTPWVREGGLIQREITRQTRSVVTLGGIEYRSEVPKRSIEVSLTKMRDGTWRRLLDALARRPAYVTYVDDKLGETTRRFYVSGPSATTDKVLGNATCFSGGSFTLEEM